MSPWIVVVDGSPLSAARVEEALRGTRYVLRSAATAAEADALLLRPEPVPPVIAAVIGAVSFPQGNGYDLARTVRARHPDAVVFLLCGAFDIYNADRAEAAGIRGRIGRPFSAEAIRRQLEQVFGPLDAAEALPPDVNPTDPADGDTFETFEGFEAYDRGYAPEEEAPLIEPDEPVAGGTDAAAAALADLPEAEYLPEDAAIPDPFDGPESLSAEAAHLEPLAAERGESGRPEGGRAESGRAEAARPETGRAGPPRTTFAVGDERLASFLPRDWRSYPAVRVDPDVVGPAVERAILEILPEVVERVLSTALHSSRSFQDMVEAAVDEAVRAQVGGIARRVIRERLAEIEAGGDES